MKDVWSATFDIAGRCWTSQRGVHRPFPLPDLFRIGVQTYLEREPPDAKAHLVAMGTAAAHSVRKPAIGFHLELDPLVAPWSVTRVDLTSPRRDGNVTIGLRMQEPLTWLEGGEQRCAAATGDFPYDVVSTRTGNHWRLEVQPARGSLAAPWLDTLSLDMRTSPAAEWPWDGIQLAVRSDAQDSTSLNGDVELSRRDED